MVFLLLKPEQWAGYKYSAHCTTHVQSHGTINIRQDLVLHFGGFGPTFIREHSFASTKKSGQC
jgi:hypothetical protein